jgi:hypothetical protein
MTKINFLKLAAVVVMVMSFILPAGFAMAQAVTLEPPIKNESGSGAEVEDIIGKIAGVIFWLGLMICPIGIIWGGFEIATAGGDQNKITKGRQIILYSIIGLVIIAISATLATVIKNILTD